MLRFIKLLPVFLFFYCLNANASHNRAGEITYTQTGDTEFEITVTTYTKASSVPADRDSLEVFFGDGNEDWVLRTNGPIGPDGLHSGELIGNDIKLNKYTTTYDYSSLSTYTITITDPNRNADIININGGASDQIAFHLETKLTITNPQSQDWNNSPTLLEAPIDNGNVGQPFTHNPNAFDIEGDSLRFELIPPKMDIATDVSGYQYPNDIMPGPDNNITLNAKTGEFKWENPQLAGEYNVAFIIREYRDGQEISSIIRDMQITVYDHENRAPLEINIPDNITVAIGDEITFDIIADDLDAGQLVRLSSTGGPYLLASSPAQFNAASDYQVPPYTGIFTWTVTAAHVRDQPYFVVFKAEDDFTDQNGAEKILSAVKTLSIKVVTEILAIKEQEVGFSINLFPNPSTELLNIELDAASIISEATLSLVDLSGKVLLEKNYYGLKKDVLSIDLEGIPVGIYYLNFRTEKGIISKSIILK